MLSLNFNNLIPDPKAEAELKEKIEQYVHIMSIRDPMNKTFQDEFAKFYQLRGWNAASKRRNFFEYFNDLFVASKGTRITYANVIDKFYPRNEKSFSSKILHTIYPDKPIIDQKVLAKLERDIDFKKKYPTPLLVKRKSGKDKYGKDKYNIIIGKDKVNDSKSFYCNLEAYYDILKSKPSTISYIYDFNNWCKNPNIGIDPSLISDTKKIDFWMWLA